MQGVESRDYDAPTHSNTEPTKSAPFPSQSSPSTGAASIPSELTAVDEKETESTQQLQASGSASSDVTALPQGTATETSHVPRKRRKFMGILGHPDRAANGEVPDDQQPPADTDEKPKKPHRHIPLWDQFKTVLFGSWVNVLLICVPVGFAVRYANLNGGAIFAVNFMAIIPLAAILSFATEELALYVGETLGGLLNASFGNATELIGMLPSSLLTVHSSDQF